MATPDNVKRALYLAGRARSYLHGEDAEGMVEVALQDIQGHLIATLQDLGVPITLRDLVTWAVLAEEEAAALLRQDPDYPLEVLIERVRRTLGWPEGQVMGPVPSLDDALIIT